MRLLTADTSFYPIPMLLNLIRQTLTPNYTEGILLLGEKKLCDTLEDCQRVIRDRNDKVKGYTAIPKGTYQIAWTYSPKFRRYCPLLINVPWFEGIRIHAGNTAADTAGCILCGVKSADGQLQQSRYTTERIYGIIQRAILEGDYVKINIS